MGSSFFMILRGTQANAGRDKEEDVLFIDGGCLAEGYVKEQFDIV